MEFVQQQERRPSRSGRSRPAQGPQTAFLMARTPKPKTKRRPSAKRAKVSKRTKAAKPHAESEQRLSQASCPIVGIGASAAGLDPFHPPFSTNPAGPRRAVLPWRHPHTP